MLNTIYNTGSIDYIGGTNAFAMKKTISLTFFFILSISLVYAQQHKADSVFKKLSKAKYDSNLVITFDSIGHSFINSKPKLAHQFTDKGLAIAKEIKFRKGEARSLNNLGLIYERTGDYTQALNYMIKAMEIYEDIDYQRGVGICLTNMSIIYSDLGDLEKCVETNVKAKDIDEDANDSSGLVTDLINIGDSYEKLNRLDSALKYTEQGYLLAKEIREKSMIGMGLNNLGNIYYKLGKYDSAKQKYSLAIPFYRDDEDDDGICEVSLGLAEVYKNKRKTDSSLYYSHLSLETAMSTDNTMRILHASSFLTDFYKTKSTPDSLYKYQQIMLSAQDSLFKQEKVAHYQRLLFSEEIRQQKLEDEKKEQAEKRTKQVQLAGISIFIPVFFILLMPLRKKKVNPKVINFMGVLALLMAYEFIMLLTEPYIGALTNERPILMLPIQVLIGALLVPLHHELEHKIKVKFEHTDKKPHH